MFENQTYRVVLSRMLDKVNEWAQEQGFAVDTREGSLIRTALSPAALELHLAYVELDEILNESFADTQTRDFLIRRCKERGIIVASETCAIRRGEFNIDVPIGSRFSLNKLNYVVVAHIENHAFELRCETPGTVGNLESGDLIPIDYIDGLTSAVLEGVLVFGEGEEDTEHLRRRYFESFKNIAFGGNKKDYRDKTEAIDGVGSVKVYPAWDGGGTVKLVIADADYNVPSTELIEHVQQIIDPTQDGQGVGLAPIGHVVTVEGVTEETTDIALTITYQDGWDWPAIEPYAETMIDAYFAELKKTWADANNIIVRISQIESRMLDLAGVLDVTDTMINGVGENFVIAANSVPKRGEMND
jgi:uncharacterized phage protein gp47/JayE